LKISVIGLGKIGLPLAAQFASKGHIVSGVDINNSTVKTINQGQTPFPGEAGLREKLEELVPLGLLRATTSFSDSVPGADAVVVAVPLLVDENTWEPDYSLIDAATLNIGKFLTAGSLISYETTLPIGTTRDRIKPLLESVSSMREGQDFDIVFSPERVLTGRVFSDLSKYPKLIGGLSQSGAQKGIKFYEKVLSFDARNDLARPNGVWDMGSAEAAEMAKLAETTYRDVNIALANQFAVYSQKVGIDINKIIEACNSQPFSHIHKPGIAVGGHCIPVYPRLYLWSDPEADLVRAARNFNSSMPEYYISNLEKQAGDLSKKKVVILGAAYRGEVKETALSGVFPLVKSLESRGVSPTVFDPFYSNDELISIGLVPHILGDDVDILILHSEHREFLELNPTNFPNVKFLLDGRNFLNKERWSGVSIIGIVDSNTV
jgi:nucleotide sugar dehydrogenase